ncbi:MAG: YicC family protein [Verrucomicrobia bacterium RIFCSPHIGHO2_12_FULL_41_10]|nr:MAG: YicC family protein [Verrucomicrobia bacterium RIFCSPHIGHO2_12_FULL_41_10]
MVSMSGFGRGSASGQGYRYHVECASVNRKGLEVVIALPKGLISLEPRIREEIQKIIMRGRIQVSVIDEIIGASTTNIPTIDIKAARQLLKEFEKLQKSLHLSGAITLETILRAPGILRVNEPEPIDPTVAWVPLRTALQEALQALLQMKTKEGKNLVTDLKKRFNFLEKATKKIHALVPKILHHRRDQLLLRLGELGSAVEKNDPSLLRELAFFADRSNISEELTRLESHLTQSQDILTQSAPGGRTLDYLAQEMFREFNTLSNKANDAEVSRWVVQSKSELDKIREQLANLE